MDHLQNYENSFHKTSYSSLKNICNLDMNLSYITENFESEIMYQDNFLKFLNIQSYEDIDVVDTIDQIYDLMKDNDFIKKCIHHISNNSNFATLCPDDSYSFLLLFSYHYFEYFYPCLVDLYRSNEVTIENQNIILNILKS